MKRINFIWPWWRAWWRWYVRRRPYATILEDKGELIAVTRRLVVCIWHYPVTIAFYELNSGKLCLFHTWQTGRYLPNDKYAALGKPLV